MYATEGAGLYNRLFGKGWHATVVASVVKNWPCESHRNSLQEGLQFDLTFMNEIGEVISKLLGRI